MSKTREKNKSVVDLTNGSIVKGMISFAVPVFLGQLLQQLYNMADAGYTLLQSSANQIEFYRQRDGERNVEIMRSLVENEAEMALQLLRAQQRDSRIGFEASNHYMYGENTLLEKILNCRTLLKKYQ